MRLAWSKSSLPLLAVAALCVLPCGSLRAADPLPQFNAQNELIRPEGYREWIFAGASLAMGYNEGAKPPENPKFHNIYIQPFAYRQYKKSGKFPEGTILMMEVLSAGSHASINRQGHFEDKVSGVEAAVKDSKHIPEGWGYFSFDGGDGKIAPTAKAFPKERCWSCHNEHGASDNVFTQFYPVLREAGSH